MNSVYLFILPLAYAGGIFICFSILVIIMHYKKMIQYGFNIAYFLVIRVHFMTYICTLCHKY